MPIPLPNVRSEILTKVIEFCEYHRPDRQPLMKPKPPPAPDQTTTAKWLDQNTAPNVCATAVKLLGPLATVPVNYGTLACVPCALTDALGVPQDTPGGSGSGAGAGLLSVPGGSRNSVSLGPEDSASQIGQTQPTAEASGSGSGNRQGDIVKVNDEVVERSRTDSLAPEMSTSVVLGPEDSASRVRVGDASGSGNQDHVGVMEVDVEKNMGKDQGDASLAVEGGHVDLDVDMNKDKKTGSLSGGAGSGEGAGDGVTEENPSETVFQTSLEAQGSLKGDSDGMKADTNKGPEKEAVRENNGGKADIDANMEPRPAGSTSTETIDDAPAGAQAAGKPEPAQPDQGEEKVEMVRMNEAEEALADKEWDKNFIDVGQDMLFSLILTANFLYIPALLELGLSTVGAAIKGKPPGEVRQMYGMPDE
ncbi:hypothetical protein FFLO_02328 [Filobasidium floriforme]|uniref:SKP1 component POZ domain-containing protein n=2 Tax=Filobasidium floriforme TaxID=5210 RepID=A0A8K0JP44_9TREE|nr:hypothetical protein FFLO_02328 [Filobasidium floriforme]